MKVLLGVALTAAAMLSTSAMPADPCNNFYTVVSNSKKYTIYNNKWNHLVAGPNSYQCTELTGQGGDFVSWKTKWTYLYNPSTSTKVKGFPNAALTMNPVQISPVSKVQHINTQMVYKLDNIKRDTVADVTYDLFTSSTIGGKKEHEIMIWLAAIGGASPIGARQNQKPIPIGTHLWNYFVGMNGDMKVHSFVATKLVSDFSGDLMNFIKYVNFPTTQYLFKLECGTEPFVGTDVSLTVSHYSAAIVMA